MIDNSKTIEELRETIRLLAELGVTDQGPRSLGGLIIRATEALEEAQPKTWEYGYVGRYPNGDKHEGLVCRTQDDAEELAIYYNGTWGEAEVDDEDRVSYTVNRRRPETPAGRWEVVEQCGHRYIHGPEGAVCTRPVGHTGGHWA